MKIYFSASENGFYTEEIHGNIIPEDAVEISESNYASLMQGQESGGIITSDDSGSPILADPPPLTAEQIQEYKVSLVQSHMDNAARCLRYDSIANAITYAEEPSVPKFQKEGQAFRAWRSLVWEKCYEILGEVESGQRAVPTDDELLAELPKLILPG